MGLAIVALLIRLWRDTGLQRDTFTDRQRWLIYGSIGAIALMIVGTDELLVVGAGHGRLDRDPGRLRLADLQHLAGSPEPVDRSSDPGGANRSPPGAESSLRARHACAPRA